LAAVFGDRLMTVEQELAEYLDTMRPWRWGTVDCTMFVADWVQQRTGLDPAASWRGTYSTAREQRDMVAAAGGLLAVVSVPMAALGFVETEDPETGDVGVIRAPIATEDRGVVMHEVAAIRQRDLWVARSLRSLFASPVPLLTIRAWRVG
jgi:hypothetical protein